MNPEHGEFEENVPEIENNYGEIFPSVQKHNI